MGDPLSRACPLIRSLPYTQTDKKELWRYKPSIHPSVIFFMNIYCRNRLLCDMIIGFPYMPKCYMMEDTLLHFAVITFHGRVITFCVNGITFCVVSFYYILRKSYYISRSYYILHKWYYISRRLLHIASVLHLAA